ncbi:hypothetical protein HK096_001189, partial [Nowakowskiella sp. JEL0078]
QLPCPTDLIQFYISPEEDEKTASSSLSANERDSLKDSDTTGGNGILDFKKKFSGRFITLGSDNNKKAGHSDGYLTRNSPAMISLTKNMEAAILSTKSDQPVNEEFESPSDRLNITLGSGNPSNTDTSTKRERFLIQSKSTVNTPSPNGHSRAMSGDTMTLYSQLSTPQTPQSILSDVALANLESKITEIFSQLANFKSETIQQRHVERDHLKHLQTSWGCLSELVETNRKQEEKIGALERRIDELERRLVEMYCGVGVAGQNRQPPPQQFARPFAPNQQMSMWDTSGFGYLKNGEMRGSGWN